jgi:phospholipase C
LPAFSWITPNQIDNTHDGTTGQGDAWLQGWITQITASPTYRAGGTVVLITWDEDDGTVDNHTPMFVISPYTAPGTQNGTYFDHYSLLHTSEELLGVPFLGNAQTATSMRGAFGL